MQTLSIVISVISLTLSLFTFYWTTLRKSRRSFFIVKLGEFATVDGPQFALVNGSKNNIMITNLTSCFLKTKLDGQFYPAQRVSFKESDCMLLPASSAFHCTINFIEPFTSTFAVSGQPDITLKDVYLHQMNIIIDWMEMNGDTHKASVPFSRVGFSDKGEIRKWSPILKKQNLFSAAT